MTSSKRRDEKLSKALTGISGEYFVAAELSRRGLVAAITLRNTRGVDILVSAEGGGTPVSVQVKTMKQTTRRWILSKSDEVSKGERHFFVFVSLNDGAEPSYYVVPGSRVANYCKRNHQDWLAGKNLRGPEPRKDSSMRNFIVADGDRGNWALIEHAVG